MHKSPNVKLSPLPKLLSTFLSQVFISVSWSHCREALPFQMVSPSSMSKFVTSIPGNVPCCDPSCTTTCPNAMSLGDSTSCLEKALLSHELGFVGGPYQDRAQLPSSFSGAFLEAALTPFSHSVSELVYKKQGCLSSSPITSLRKALPLCLYSSYLGYTFSPPIRTVRRYSLFFSLCSHLCIAGIFGGLFWVFFNIMGLSKLNLVAEEGKDPHQTQVSIVVKHLDFKHRQILTA